MVYVLYLVLKNGAHKCIFWGLGRGLAIPVLKRSVRENVFEINNDFSNLIRNFSSFSSFIYFWNFPLFFTLKVGQNYSSRFPILPFFHQNFLLKKNPLTFKTTKNPPELLKTNENDFLVLISRHLLNIHAFSGISRSRCSKAPE